MTPGQLRALETLWPRYGLEATSGVLDFDAVFGRQAPRALEIGFGNGGALGQMAAARPEWDFIGIEVHRPGVGRLLQHLDEQELDNVRVLCADAMLVLRDNIAPSSLDHIMLFFPDPWPKKKHHKRRILNDAFLDQVARLLKPAGVFHAATDWADYAVQMRDRLDARTDLALIGTDRGERPLTKYEQRGQRLGHDVSDLAYQLKKP